MTLNAIFVVHQQVQCRFDRVDSILARAGLDVFVGIACVCPILRMI